MDRHVGDTIDLTADLVSAYVSNNRVPPAELPAFIASLHAALTGLGQNGATDTPAVEKATPAQIRKSVSHEALISFEDGKPYKTLRRHLATKGLTPEAYREKWGLPADYPMVAASYRETRSALAKSLGLGRIGGMAAPRAAPVEEPAPAAEASEKPKRASQPRKAEEPAPI